MENNITGKLEINTDVIEKMASVAALEVEGTAALSNKAVDLAGVVNTGSALKPVRVTVKNGAVSIDVYICVKQGINVKTIAEAVQANVKDKVQDMTGNAITNVNVHVADLETVAAE